MKALCILSLAFGQDFEVPARPLDWKELCALFQPTWTLPAEPDAGRDLLAEMKRLVELSFERNGKSGRLGDLVVETQGLDPAQRTAWFEQLESQAPELMADWGAGLRELLQEDHLFRERWKPGRDYSRDGILIAEGWRPSRESAKAWIQRSCQPRIEQAATIYRADLDTIKRVENDYRLYFDHVGAQYEELYPLEKNHFSGADDEGLHFRFLRLHFRSDLPFPFSDYSCDLRILNRVDSEGILHTDIFSPSRDFNYMVGRDVFLPVETASGTTVAYLAVRQFGFDINNVPDDSGHRQAALRSTLGNLKRQADLDFEATESSFRPAAEVLADLRVLGHR